MEIKRNNTPVKNVAAGVLLVSGIYLFRYLSSKLEYTKPIKVIADPNQLSKILFDPDNMQWKWRDITTGRINPDKLAVYLGHELQYKTMSGKGAAILQTIDKLYTYNDVRALHNSFIKYIDKDITLYDLVKKQLALDNAFETVKNNMLIKLAKAGVSTVQKIKIPKDQYLLK